LGKRLTILGEGVNLRITCLAGVGRYDFVGFDEHISI